jgi:hypothetical protein
MDQKRPESLLSLLKALGEFSLVIFGIIGIAVEIFNDDGMLSHLLGKIMDAALASSMLVTIGVIAGLVAVKIVFDRIFSSAANAKALGDFMMFVMMALGVFFLYHVTTTGTFKI